MLTESPEYSMRPKEDSLGGDDARTNPSIGSVIDQH